MTQASTFKQPLEAVLKTECDIVNVGYIGVTSDGGAVVVIDPEAMSFLSVVLTRDYRTCKDFASKATGADRGDYLGQAVNANDLWAQMRDVAELANEQHAHGRTAALAMAVRRDA